MFRAGNQTGKRLSSRHWKRLSNKGRVDPEDKHLLNSCLDGAVNSYKPGGLRGIQRGSGHPGFNSLQSKLANICFICEMPWQEADVNPSPKSPQWSSI